MGKNQEGPTFQVVSNSLRYVKKSIDKSAQRWYNVDGIRPGIL